jgi:hypothetical protein
MDDEFDWQRRDQLVARLDRMVQSGRMTEPEANRLRAASDAETFNSAVRDIRLRHARNEIDHGVEAGSLTRAEADALLGRIAQGDHDRSLRSQIGRLTRNSQADTACEDTGPGR